jgi:hypothetical protein
VIADKIAALPPWADEISLGGLGEDPRDVDLAAAFARLELAREWIQRSPHDPDCAGVEWVAVPQPCSCGRDALLKALEVPR